MAEADADAFQEPVSRTVRVWDWPVRLTHWGFAIFIPLSWWTAENSEWAWHERSGMILLGLLIFRIVWGVVGTPTARFSNFIKGPGRVLAYLRGTASHTIGHNPIGALSVVALLAAMLVQVMMGLFAGDPYDGLTGPLNSMVGVMTADTLTEWHETFYWVVLGLVALHLAAIAFYAVVKRNNLVTPMVTGRRVLEADVEGIEASPWGRVIIAAAVSIGTVVWVAYGLPPFG